jgi:5'-3' exonuclease
MSLRSALHNITLMKTLIIDGNNLIHRTWWTAKNQGKRQGIEDSELIANMHIYFTLNAIYSYANKFKPTKTICVWDEKEDYQPNIRKEQLDGYKGTRSNDSTPHHQNDQIKEMLSCLGIPSIFPREREADDIVAYICKSFEGEKVIVSVDRDFLQLVDNKTVLYDAIRKKEFRLETFTEDTGYTKSEWLNAKCLLGDKSDNVPGIPRFGKAKVRKWLDGELTLTDEQEEIFTKNMTVFNLNEVMSHESEATYYQEQLDVDIEARWSEFVCLCEEYKMENILKKKEAWHTLFIMSNKLLSMFG